MKKLLARLARKVIEIKSGQGSFETHLVKAQKAWLREMSGYVNRFGIVQLPDYPILSKKHVENCKVFPLREHILETMPKGGKVAEMGVQEGEFSQKILQICSPAELHLIDIALTPFKVAERFRTEIERGTVELHEGDSADIISAFPDGYFDFIYIDADHRYSGVKRDIEAAHSKVRRGGFILFNDYTFWSSAECTLYGVVQAVNELCIEDDWEIVSFAFGYVGYSDVALRRIKDAPE